MNKTSHSQDNSTDVNAMAFACLNLIRALKETRSTVQILHNHICTANELNEKRKFKAARVFISEIAASRALADLDEIQVAEFELELLRILEE